MSRAGVTGFLSCGNFSQIAGTTVQSGFSEVTESINVQPSTSVQQGAATLDELMRTFNDTKKAPDLEGAIAYEPKEDDAHKNISAAVLNPHQTSDMFSVKKISLNSALD